jgi:hypothetical protein
MYMAADEVIRYFFLTITAISLDNRGQWPHIAHCFFDMSDHGHFLLVISTDGFMTGRTDHHALRIGIASALHRPSLSAAASQQLHPDICLSLQNDFKKTIQNWLGIAASRDSPPDPTCQHDPMHIGSAFFFGSRWIFSSEFPHLVGSRGLRGFPLQRLTTFG